ncbi:MAG: hypothetical protein ABI873_16105 [Marmoricola sp.]
MHAPLSITALGVPVDLRFHGPRAAEARAALASRWALCARTELQPGARTVDVRFGTATAVELDGSTVGGTDLSRLMVEVTHAITFHLGRRPQRRALEQTWLSAPARCRPAGAGRR